MQSDFVPKPCAYIYDHLKFSTNDYQKIFKCNIIWIMSEKKLLCKEISYVSAKRKKKKIDCSLGELKFAVINIKSLHSYFAIHVLITANKINSSIQ